MTEIPERPLDKIAIDLVMECKTSTSGNEHILTIIDHLTGLPESFPTPDKSADMIVSTFINHYLPVHMCPKYILSDNGTEFKNQLVDQVFQQLGTNHIFSAPYHPQRNGKLEVFHKYLKPTLKKLCEKDPTNWGQIYKPSTCQLLSTTKSCYSRDTFHFSLWKRPNLPLHQLLEPMQCFLGDPESRRLNFENHHLTLAIVKKTLDENHFRNAQKTTDRKPPSFQLGDRVYFKNKQQKMGFKMETWI